MKPSIVFLIAGLLFSAANHAHATSAHFSGAGNDPLVPASLSPDTRISGKALGHFQKKYKDATNVQWSVIDGGFLAYSTVEGVVNRAYYDREGDWTCTIQYYDECKLPAEVGQAVKSTYYGYSISTVEEVDLPHEKVYMIDIRDKDNGRTIRVCGDEMEEVPLIRS